MSPGRKACSCAPSISSSRIAGLRHSSARASPRCGRFPGASPHLALARDLLGTGRFALAAASGLFDDGTPFALPDDAPLPPPLLVPQTARNVLVHLAVPLQQPGSVEVSNTGREGRYDPEGFDAYDTHSGATEPTEVLIGHLRLRFLLETDDRAGYVCLPVARIVEVASDERVVLDDRWIPPVTGVLCDPEPGGADRGALRLAQPARRGDRCAPDRDRHQEQYRGR